MLQVDPSNQSGNMSPSNTEFESVVLSWNSCFSKFQSEFQKGIWLVQFHFFFTTYIRSFFFLGLCLSGRNLRCDHDIIEVIRKVRMWSISGWCCWPGEESRPDGLHLCWVTTFSDSGVLGRVEHGKLGRNFAVCYCWVRLYSFSLIHSFWEFILRSSRNLLWSALCPVSSQD